MVCKNYTHYIMCIKSKKNNCQYFHLIYQTDFEQSKAIKYIFNYRHGKFHIQDITKKRNISTFVEQTSAKSSERTQPIIIVKVQMNYYEQFELHYS